MNAPSRLSLLQRWYRLRTSPRFPFAVFALMLLAGLLSQVYVYWWAVRIEEMVNHNNGSVERISVYPAWVRQRLGNKFVSRFEPIRRVNLRIGIPQDHEVDRHDLRLLYGASFLSELYLFDKLTSDDAKQLRYLKGLRTAYFFNGTDPELVLDGVEKLPNLKTLYVTCEPSTSPQVHRRIAAMSQLEKLACYLSVPPIDGDARRNVAAGWAELRASPTLYRLETVLISKDQLAAITNPLPDGTPPFPNLHELRLAGSFESAFGDHSQLKHLPNLIHLDLTRSSIVDAQITQLKELPHLRTLYLEGNAGITDKGAEVLASMHNLQSLNVKLTGISNAGLLHLATLPRLRCLRAYSHSPNRLEFKAELRKNLPVGCELDTN